MNAVLVKLKTVRSRLRAIGRVDPVRDWIALITIAGVILLGIIGVDVWQFNVITDASMQVPASSAAQRSFNLKEFETVKTLITSRASEQQKYINGAYTFTDPSK